MDMPSLPIVEAADRAYEVHHDWGELPASIRYGNCHGVQVDSEGFVYVHHTVHADSPSDHSVVVFDPQGAFVRSWGGAFAGGAHGFRLTRESGDEFLYFCDIRRGIVQKTSLDGKVLLTLGYPSESPAYAVGEGRLAPSCPAGALRPVPCRTVPATGRPGALFPRRLDTPLCRLARRARRR